MEVTILKYNLKGEISIETRVLEAIFSILIYYPILLFSFTPAPFSMIEGYLFLGVIRKSHSLGDLFGLHSDLGFLNC